MDRWSRSFFAGLATLFAFCLFIAPARADFDAAYCSSQNTAGDFSAMFETWQSNGWCTDHCNTAGKYAFAVILEKNCWCSDYIPEDQRDTGDCSTSCPGFPSEKCGNVDDNLYIYIKLANDPSGTVGGSQPTSTNVSPSPTATSSPPPSSTEAPSSSEATSTKSSTPTTLRTTTTQEEVTPPQTSIRVVTESGAIITQTVVTTPTSAPVQQTQKSSSNTGAIVGGVVGGLFAVIAVVGGIFFILWRRRRQQKQDLDPQTGVQRNTSTMSKSGLLQTEKQPQFPPPIVTNFNNRRQSRNLDQDSISPISGSDRRNSRHLVDQRLNPSTIFVFDNTSTGSLGSVDDSRDYHRPLNVRNPDPEA
ncbi:hypothetical protein K458DRAFT_141521 [Lentithecium fluviatile CBS 122367]|uniref:receptor protein-tyrosine kinase n=1 Tax=Lentithecium fluviatile CBS 122367 TaxID=1168545 RepID=A0A6G1IIR7_9PLEO|nr:hypothetical protein K458DRAFT_141521 [Lentithecium fluviatile CBS 122367]